MQLYDIYKYYWKYRSSSIVKAHVCFIKIFECFSLKFFENKNILITSTRLNWLNRSLCWPVKLLLSSPVNIAFYGFIYHLMYCRFGRYLWLLDQALPWVDFNNGFTITCDPIQRYPYRANSHLIGFRLGLLRKILLEIAIAITPVWTSFLLAMPPHSLRIRHPLHESQLMTWFVRNQSWHRILSKRNSTEGYRS